MALLDVVVPWIRATQASEWINQSTWIWPLCETLHFIGLSLLVGITGFFDLRLMGCFRQVSVAAARDLMPLALAGFALNGVTGVVFLIGLPEQYAYNWVWWSKVSFLMVAGLNALWFETTMAAKVLALDDGADTPRVVKLVGLVSLVVWIAVLFFGRMLPFLGDAY